MENNLRLLEKITLENGLDLCIYDGSRVIAGDRWLVSLTARMEIPVDQDEMKTVLGDSVFFEKKMERHFIAQDEKPLLLAGIRTSLMAALVKYLALPDFPEKYTRKCYREYQQKQGWYNP